MAGRAPSGQALAVPATPVPVDGPSGLDPSRGFSALATAEDLEFADEVTLEEQPLAHLALCKEAARHLRCLPRLELENGALRHYAENCDEEIRAWRDGRGPEYVAEMRAMDEGLAALATEAQRAETPQSGSVHEGAGRDSGNAQPLPPQSNKGEVM